MLLCSHSGVRRYNSAIDFFASADSLADRSRTLSLSYSTSTFYSCGRLQVYSTAAAMLKSTENNFPLPEH